MDRESYCEIEEKIYPQFPEFYWIVFLMAELLVVRTFEATHRMHSNIVYHGHPHTAVASATKKYS